MIITPEMECKSGPRRTRIYDCIGELVTHFLFEPNGGGEKGVEEKEIR